MSTNKILEQLQNKLPDDVTGIKVTIPISISEVIPAGTVALAATETNEFTLVVPHTEDSVGHFEWIVPIDYSEGDDYLKVRFLAGLLAMVTDDDVELDLKVYVKTATTALGSDLDPTKPGTVLALYTTGAAWIVFDLSANSLNPGDVVVFNLITDGHNDTDGDNVEVGAIQIEYKSTIVAGNIADR